MEDLKDNWNLKDSLIGDEKHNDEFEMIKILKAKILKDMEDIIHCVNDFDGITVDDSCYKSDVEEILDKRFGF